MNRLVVVEWVYHQTTGRQPFGLEHRHSRRLVSDEQPWGPREVTLTPEWAALPQGWIKVASLLRIVNAGTEVVEVAAVRPGAEAAVADWFILPGADMRGHPANIGVLRLRCQRGSCKVLVTLFPE